MANLRQPIELVVLNGKAHLTEKQIEERRNSEIHPASDCILPPKYLNAKQREEFLQLSAELKPLDIVSNLDTGELARYCVAHSLYQRYTKLLRQSPKKLAARKRREAEEKGVPIASDVSDEELSLDMEAVLVKLHCKYFEQCESCARALGLNITSRCRLVVPKAQEPERENKFARFDRQRSG